MLEPPQPCPVAQDDHERHLAAERDRREQSDRMPLATAEQLAALGMERMKQIRERHTNWLRKLAGIG